MLDIIFENPFYIKHREFVLCMVDLFIVVVSFFLAYWSKIDFDFDSVGQIDIMKVLMALFVILIVYAISFFAFKIHKSLWKYISLIETFRISLSVICASIVLIIFILLTSINRFYISVVFVAGLLTILMMFNVRLGYRLLRRYTAKSEEPKKNVIIIGAGDGGYILLKEILQNDKMHANVVGFVDDQRVHKMISGYTVLGSTYDLPEIVNKYKVNEAYIAIPSASKKYEIGRAHV